MAASQTKTDLRQNQLRARRQTDVAGKSAAITHHLEMLIDELGARTVASYHAIAGEPDVSRLNHKLEARGALLLPAVEGDGLIWRLPGDMIAGPFGTKSPTGVISSLESADLVLVPALAVDAQGFRLGRGGGYYDRALAQLRPQSELKSRRPRLLAVVFDHEVMDELPHEPHDVPMDGVVTEAGVRWFI